MTRKRARKREKPTWIEREYYHQVMECSRRTCMICGDPVGNLLRRIERLRDEGHYPRVADGLYCEACADEVLRGCLDVAELGLPSGYRPARSSCLLHVGFPFIEETPEHLANLRRYFEPPGGDGTARSRIATTTEQIRPIDRVARRVTGFPQTPAGPDSILPT
jgi:hypothetical protein